MSCSGRHVRVLALDDSDLRGRRGLEHLDDSEVGQLDRAGSRHEDVARADVAMDEVGALAIHHHAGVDVLEGTRHREPDLHRDANAEPLATSRGATHQSIERRAIYVFHRDEVLAVDFAEIEDLHDVRVTERRCDLRFLNEHAPELGRARELGADPLDDARLLETAWTHARSEVDRRHPAFGDTLREAVAPEGYRAGVGVNRHRALDSGTARTRSDQCMRVLGITGRTDTCIP